jgi:hypothetical protein
MPFNDSSSALVAVMISIPYADAGNVGLRRFKRIMALRSIGGEVCPFGSKADIPQCNRHVRFSPESRQSPTAVSVK